MIDQHRVGTGVTGHTTAKLSSLHQLVYAQFAERFGQEGARTYAAANEAGSRGSQTSRRAPDRVRLPPPAQLHLRRLLRRPPGRPGRGGGRPARRPERFVREPGAAPVPHRGRDQARQSGRVPPAEVPGRAGRGARARGRAHLRGHAGAPPARGSAVQGRDHRRRGPADHVVVATHFPFPDRGLFFARVHAERSYCVAAPLTGPPPEGMFISASSPTRSLRFHPVAGQEVVIVGGEGHKVGQGGPTSPRYEALEEFTREHFDAGEVPTGGLRRTTTRPTAPRSWAGSRPGRAGATPRRATASGGSPWPLRRRRC